MKYQLLYIFIFFCTSIVPQSFCTNSDFEEGSFVSPVPGTITVATMNAINGWTATSGSNTASVTSCNLNMCCPSPPNAIQLISAVSTSGYIDPNIGVSYPVFSQFDNFFVPNAGPGYGDWFCKLNDDISNKSIQKISSYSANTPFVTFRKVAILPVMSTANHACCSTPAIKIVLKDGLGNIISSPNFSITTTTSCSGVYNWSVCPANNNYQFSPWQVFWFPVMTYTSTNLEITVADCSDGAHAAYVYIDADCYNFDITANGVSNTNVNTNPVTVCGNTCAILSVPSGFNSYLWAGPDPNVNGATTQTVNACVNGVYTITVNAPNFINPYPITFTLNCVPNPTTNLTISQPTACAGSGTISLNGTPPGGVYTGSFVTGNAFNPSTNGNYTIQYTYTDSNGCKDSTTNSVSVASCTGMRSYTVGSFEFSLQPQPSGDIVTITLDNFDEPVVQVKILDIAGKNIFNLDLAVRNNKALLEVPNLNSGVYIISLKNLKGQSSQKRLIIIN